MTRKPDEIVDRYGKDAAMDRYTKKPQVSADPRIPIRRPKKTGKTDAAKVKSKRPAFMVNSRD